MKIVWVILKTLLSLLTMVTLLLLLIYAALSTSTGTRIALDITSKFVPGHLQLHNIQGNLLTSLSIDKLHYLDKNIELNISAINLQWQPQQLWHRRLVINNLQANIVHIQIKEKKSKRNGKFSLPKIPVSIELNQFAVNKLTIHYAADKPAIIINHTQLHFITSQPKIDIALNATLQAPTALTINTAITGTINNYQINAEIKNPSLDWKISGQGDQNFLHLATSENKKTNSLPKIQLDFKRESHKIWRLNQPWQLNFALTNFKLSLLNFLLPNAMQLRGNLNLDLTAEAKTNHETYAQFKLKTTPVNLIYADTNQKININFKQITAQANMTPQGLTGNLTINLTKPYNPLILNFALPKFNKFAAPTSRQKINAELHWQLQQLNLLATYFSNYLANPQGNININLKLTGSFAHPHYTGQFTLKNGSVNLPTQALKLQNISANISAKNTRLTYQASAQSGSGNIQINGYSNLTNNNIHTQLQLSGQNFLVSNTSELMLTVSPKLALTQQNKFIKINGNILIPQANIQPRDFSSTVTLPDEVVFINQQQPKSQHLPLQIVTHINVIPGDKIYINFKGLTGRLTGKLDINDEPNRPTTGNGYISIINGKYAIYGQTLIIRNGRLIFTNSPITNPNVDIQAIQTIKITPATTISTLTSQTLVVGINLQGTLNNPKITLFSEPAGLSSTDILSYLIIGKPASEATDSNADLLFRAASALAPSGAGGFNQITQQLQQTFGFSDFGLQTEQQMDPSTKQYTQGTSFVLGKYLTPRLYFNYSIGLMTTANVLRLRYILTKRWAIQTQASTAGNGVDLLYTHERK